ncbi:hypothetical protein HKX42_08495 [Salinisphaera sp. USBA-960]|nr:hypothetical protein [Salifodinibacter halophilus]
MRDVNAADVPKLVDADGDESAAELPMANPATRAGVRPHLSMARLA